MIHAVSKVSLVTRLTVLLGVVVAALAVVGGTGWLASGRAAASLDATLAQMATLRASMQADMMHDALRADVLLALRLGSAGTRGSDADWAALGQDVADHTASFEASLKQILTSGTPAAQDEARRVEPLVRQYLDGARGLTARPGPGTRSPTSDQEAYDAFLADFRALESGMETLGDVIQADASRAAAESRSTISGDQNVLTWAAVVALATVALVAVPVFGRVTPLRRYAREFDRAAEGDLTVSLHEGHQDEVGRLARALNRFLISLVGGLGGIRSAARRLAQTSDQLAREAQEMAEAVERVGENSAGVEGQFTALGREIVQTETAVQDVGVFFGQVTVQIDHQAAALARSSALIEQMNASIESMADLAAAKGAVASELARTAQDGEGRMGATVAMIGQASRNAQGIHQMTQAIEEIAAKTNLLAMNAAIEAAHAGRAGLGFAVVASEIRKLAESSTASARSIGEALQIIVDAIQKAQAVAEDTGRTFAAMVERIATVVSGMDEVRQATQALAVASGEILGALGRLNAESDEVRAGVGTAEARVAGIRGAMGALKDLSRVTADHLASLNRGLAVLADASQTVQTAGSANEAVVQSLEGLVAQYHLPEGDD